MQTTAEGCLIKEFWFCTKRMISFWECRIVLATLHPINKGFPSSRCRWSPVKWPNLSVSNCPIYTSGGTAQLLKHHAPPESFAWPISVCILHWSGPSECYFRHCLLPSQTGTVLFKCPGTFSTFFYMFSTTVCVSSTSRPHLPPTATRCTTWIHLAGNNLK